MATNQWTALNAFWNSFGLTAYDSITVPDGAVMPYITYEAGVGELESKIMLTASIWYRSNSWADISEKALQISDAIGGGMGVNYTGGRLWVTKETPFAQRMAEDSDDAVRRIVLQIGAEFH